MAAFVSPPLLSPVYSEARPDKPALSRARVSLSVPKSNTTVRRPSRIRPASARLSSAARRTFFGVSKFATYTKQSLANISGIQAITNVFEDEKDFRNWTPDRLAEFIKSLAPDPAELPAFTTYAANFKADRINGKGLEKVTEDDLIELGVKLRGHRKLLLFEFEELSIKFPSEGQKFAYRSL
eukprot:CAMPEP_0184331134 /NCGR_PEP_ID=MMETSP1089-20130417/439_1 /TAXON_ID=38269 ORGANISM="Gloeochaete wittrockiana, Strain SAG46.84" /NCGR_SAMPLE_ID=MMETSP1089 /ASSEMBLY_ACC=CAM_ASM_000445 /LENGTH=181 /DNA_ID=CAMNT_0026653843 /DNA_START=116 /DNA_END=661 /DNA_ORIENTATION=+